LVAGPNPAGPTDKNLLTDIIVMRSFFIKEAYNKTFSQRIGEQASRLIPNFLDRILSWLLVEKSPDSIQSQAFNPKPKKGE
jgi:hypothetical protein